MGRSILVEDYIENKLNSLVHRKPYTFGVIIGKLSQQKDYVVHVARTPPNEETGDNSRTEELNEKWIAKHACQVENMLCGGLNVIGLFVIAQPDVLKDLQHRLRQVLFAAHKALSKNNYQSTTDDAINDRILLQICAASRKLTCQTFDISDNSSVARPADWKYQHFLDRWLSLSCQQSFNVRIIVTVEMGSKSLKKQIQMGLGQTCTNIRNCVGLINDQFQTDDDLLDPAPLSPSKRKNKKHDEPSTLRHFNVELLTLMNEAEAEAPVSDDCCAHMLLRGTVSARAYVQPRSTVKEALTALREDCVNTLIQRCDLLCEDLLSSEEEQDARVVYETPRRVTVVLPDTPIAACDYVFMDETATESQQRFKEFLDVAVQPEDIDMNCEPLPVKDDLSKPAFGNDKSSLNSCESFVSFDNTTPAVDSQSHLPRTGIMLASVFALLWAIVVYAYISLNPVTTQDGEDPV